MDPYDNDGKHGIKEWLWIMGLSYWNCMLKQKPAHVGYTCTKHCETLVSWTMSAGDYWGSTSSLGWPDQHNLQTKEEASWDLSKDVKGGEPEEEKHTYKNTKKNGQNNFHNKNCPKNNKKKQNFVACTHTHTQKHIWSTHSHYSRTNKSSNELIQKFYHRFNPFNPRY